MKKLAIAVTTGALGVILLGASPVSAEEATPIPLDDTQMILDNTFIFIAAILVLFMQAGFALLAAGLTSAKNVGNMMMKNMMDMVIGHLWF
jgi:Amt family ammonium transporter